MEIPTSRSSGVRQQRHISCISVGWRLNIPWIAHRIHLPIYNYSYPLVLSWISRSMYLSEFSTTCNTNQHGLPFVHTYDVWNFSQSSHQLTQSDGKHTADASLPLPNESSMRSSLEYGLRSLKPPSGSREQLLKQTAQSTFEPRAQDCTWWMD